MIMLSEVIHGIAAFLAYLNAMPIILFLVVFVFDTMVTSKLKHNKHCGVIIIEFNCHSDLKIQFKNCYVNGNIMLIRRLSRWLVNFIPDTPPGKPSATPLTRTYSV